ncbi:MAG: putative manganese-dependent inorganic diphosphatase, partial [Planctomycetales bacterium]|nr:putative manganese-dependent inorganic diphosphatase [Planctomycetales bacterium]
ADLLQKTTYPDAVAACCGPPNTRTEFTLRMAGVAAPRIIMDVRPEIGDICQSHVVTAGEQDAFFEVCEKLQQHKIRAIPIISDDGRLTGILSLLDLLELVFHADDDDPILSRQVHSSLAKICQAVGGHYQTNFDSSRHENVLVMVGAMSAEGFTRRLDLYDPANLLVVSGDRPTIHLPALERGVRGLVVTGGYQLSPGLLQLAQLNNVTVICSPHDTATTVMRIKSARTITSAITRDFTPLSDKQLIDEARRAVGRSEQPIFPVLDDDDGLVGVLSKSDLIYPPKTRLILVDHNELAQAVAGAEESEILEVLDHHRLGGSIRSAQPIRFINEPVGSTSTLVARQFRAAGVTPSPGIALCLCAGIISDTLYLRSPTTTDVDRELLNWLREQCQRDLDDFARQFFEIGSALRSCSPHQVLHEDCKEFTEQGHRFTISQIEELGFELFWKRKGELQEALDAMTDSRGLDFAALLITDIATNGSLLLMSREPEGWEEINYPRVDRHLYELNGIVSRKKQLLPLISRILGIANTT